MVQHKEYQIKIEKGGTQGAYCYTIYGISPVNDKWKNLRTMEGYEIEEQAVERAKRYIDGYSERLQVKMGIHNKLQSLKEANKVNEYLQRVIDYKNGDAMLVIVECDLNILKQQIMVVLRRLRR